MESKSRLRRAARVAAALAILALAVGVGYRRGYQSGYEVDDPMAGKPGSLYIQTYPVGDLVLPLGALDPAERTSNAVSATTGMPGPDFDSLIDLIVTTVDHDSWLENGSGEGEIQPFPTNMSLVISQTGRVHEQVADLIEQLRKFNAGVDAKELVPYLQSCAALGQNAATTFRTLPLNDKCRAAMRKMFATSLDSLAGLWGQPAFRGTNADEDFPSWLNADQAAYWPRGEGVAYVAVENQPGVGCVLAAGWRRVD